MLKTNRVISVVATFAFAWVASCSTSASSGFGSSGGSDGGGPDSTLFGGDAEGCAGLQCKQVACDNGKTTTLSGTVFAPNGTLPLYNAIVYVPNEALAPLPKGASCDRCGTVTSGKPVVIALSDSKGQFTLENVPVVDKLPLVIQIGKWRRQVEIPTIEKCTDNKITDSDLTRLPKNQSEGDMPKIALTTGGCDLMGCLLPKVGIDPNEFGFQGDGDSKAVHLYRGTGSPTATGPTTAPAAKAFWSDAANMQKYDVAILSCECSESPSSKDGITSYGAVTDYLSAGGRIFTTDFQYLWYKNSTDPQMKSAMTIPGGAPGGLNPVKLDTSFPKGQALAEWLKTVSPSSTAGQFKADTVYDNISAVDPAKVQTWATAGNNKPHIVTLNTPVGKPVDEQCGKGVHIDVHVNNASGGSGDQISATYPRSCVEPLSDSEKVLAFFFFDLASCIQKEDAKPVVPK